MGTGVALQLAVALLPSSPEPLFPQQSSWPSANAHVCLAPAMSRVTLAPSPETGTGRDLSVCVPSPNWPSALLPQQ